MVGVCDEEERLLDIDRFSNLILLGMRGIFYDKLMAVLRKSVCVKKQTDADLINALRKKIESSAYKKLAQCNVDFLRNRSDQLVFLNIWCKIPLPDDGFGLALYDSDWDSELDRAVVE